jgi:hypothetical protein
VSHEIPTNDSNQVNGLDAEDWDCLAAIGLRRADRPADFFDEIVGREERFQAMVRALSINCFAAAKPPRRQRKPRQPNIPKMITTAEKTGKKVTSVTTPEGVTLRFGESEQPAEASNNPWLDDLKVTKQ